MVRVLDANVFRRSDMMIGTSILEEITVPFIPNIFGKNIVRPVLFTLRKYSMRSSHYYEY
jgi:hypothetical protein